MLVVYLVVMSVVYSVGNLVALSEQPHSLLPTLIDYSADLENNREIYSTNYQTMRLLLLTINHREFIIQTNSDIYEYIQVHLSS